MKLWKLTNEFIIFLLVFVLAAGLRLVALGQQGVSDAEATLALQAYNLAAGKTIALDPHAIYLLPTAFFIFLFGASNFIVRFWPAVAGSFLVFFPYFIRARIGRVAAIVMAIFLAIDPGLTAASRQANSVLMTVVVVLFALVFWYRKQSALAGIFGGLSLLGGPQLWPGILGLGLTGWFAFKLKLWDAALIALPTDVDIPMGSFQWRKAFGYGLASFLIVGSLLFRVPQGLGVALGSLPGYLLGWVKPSDISFGMLISELWAYEALGVVLGLIGCIGAIKSHDAIDRILGMWLGISLLLALAYPGKQMFDLAWCLLPILALAARQLVRIVQVNPSDRLIHAGEAILVVILLAFMIYTGLSWPKSGGNPPIDTTWPWIKLGVSAVLIVAVTGLIGWGWNGRLAVSGLASGIIILLATLFVSGCFHAAGFSRYPETELMQTGPVFVDANLVRTSMKNFSEWKPKPEKDPQITVVGISSPALEWELRNFPQIQYVQSLVKDSQPDMMVTPENMSPEMTSAYRGEGFYLVKTPAWSLMFTQEWMQWLIYRNVPEGGMSYQKIILWVRTDIFPGGAGVPVTTGTK
jgi:hypothetical protein